MLNNDDLKPAITIEDQIKKLKERGMIIRSDNYAKTVLSYVSYYRLSPYSLGLRTNDTFHNNVSIEKTYNLYRFDEELRILLFRVIEPIEIKLRAALSNHLAVKYGNICHLDSSIFRNKRHHRNFIKAYRKAIDSQKNTPFVAHNINKYKELPIWAAVEVLSMGQLSKLFNNLHKDDIDQIVCEFKSSSNYFPGWIETLCYIRNICAHNGRIYNRVIAIRPQLLSKDKRFNQQYAKIFVVIIIIARIYHEKGSAWRSFVDDFTKLVEEYKDDIDLVVNGFPNDWRKELE